MVLLYCNIDEYELDEQEQIAKLNKYHQAMDTFYQLISSGELKNGKTISWKQSKKLDAIRTE